MSSQHFPHTRRCADNNKYTCLFRHTWHYWLWWNLITVNNVSCPAQTDPNRKYGKMRQECRRGSKCHAVGSAAGSGIIVTFGSVHSIHPLVTLLAHCPNASLTRGGRQTLSALFYLHLGGCTSPFGSRLISTATVETILTGPPHLGLPIPSAKHLSVPQTATGILSDNIMWTLREISTRASWQ